ncbi:MAG: metallophosphoesterase [Bacteroidales bacterium]
MKKIKLAIIVLLVAFSINTNAQELVILHTNDTHSQITPQTAGNGKGLGGYERREAYIKSVRASNKNVILLDAGDFSQGTPYFTVFKGDVEIELMNELKYDAVCIGNHEFDNGQKELARRIKDAKFPLLCANYEFNAEKSPLYNIVKPYTIIKRAGKKIGIIGVLSQLKGLVSPNNTEGIKFEHPYKIVNNLALNLKNNEKCDLIILLTHVGYDRGKEQNPSDDMIAKNSENIDLVIGGHSHTYIKKPKIVKNKLGKKVVIVTAGEKGEHVGRVDIKF